MKTFDLFRIEERRRQCRRCEHNGAKRRCETDRSETSTSNSNSRETEPKVNLSSSSSPRTSAFCFSVNLWSIIKNCVGKDLSKIPIPVNFSEPLSMLQRVTEELEYSSVLDRAAQATDSWEQLAYVAAFTVSSYSTTATRANKPFNPLLGETFECDRTDDFGWKVLSGKNSSQTIERSIDSFLPP